MKSSLLRAIRHELRLRLDRLSQAALEAHAAATDPGSKAESKYDTRTLEASYLASGHARQVEETADAWRIFENLTLPDFAPDAAIDAGALVETDLAGETSLFLLVPAAGGLVISHEGRDVTLLTPASALYQNLLGRHVGESLDAPPLQITEIL